MPPPEPRSSTISPGLKRGQRGRIAAAERGQERGFRNGGRLGLVVEAAGDGIVTAAAFRPLPPQQAAPCPWRTVSAARPYFCFTISRTSARSVRLIVSVIGLLLKLSNIRTIRIRRLPRYSASILTAAWLTPQIMFFPRRSTVISPARRSSFRWWEIRELICSAPVTRQQTSPTVGPTIGRTAPVSSTATGPQQERRNSKISRRVGSPNALNIVATSSWLRTVSASIHLLISRNVEMILTAESGRVKGYFNDLRNVP